jgi:hypothetical protein
MNFNFIQKTHQDELLYNPSRQYYKYYQLCSFKNPKINKYHIRRFIMNSMQEFTDIKELYINDKQFNKFKDSHKLNEYKMYNAYNLSNIPYPSLGEISIIMSPMFENNNLDYGNFSKF